MKGQVGDSVFLRRWVYENRSITSLDDNARRQTSWMMMLDLHSSLDLLYNIHQQHNSPHHQVLYTFHIHIYTTCINIITYIAQSESTSDHQPRQIYLHMSWIRSTYSNKTVVEMHAEDTSGASFVLVQRACHSSCNHRFSILAFCLVKVCHQLGVCRSYWSTQEWRSHQ